MPKIISFLCFLFLTSCVAPRIEIVTQDSSFNLEKLGSTPLVLRIIPGVTLKDFKKSFESVYINETIFRTTLLNTIGQLIKFNNLNVFIDTSSERNHKLDSKYKYAVTIYNTTIGQTSQASPYGVTQRCVVDFLVMISDVQTGTNLMTFTVGDQVGVLLFAYETALQSAINKASFALIKLIKPSAKDIPRLNNSIESETQTP